MSYGRNAFTNSGTTIDGMILNVPFIDGHFRVCEFMPPQDIIAAEIVGAEISEDNYERLVVVVFFYDPLNISGHYRRFLQ